MGKIEALDHKKDTSGLNNADDRKDKNREKTERRDKKENLRVFEGTPRPDVAKAPDAPTLPVEIKPAPKPVKTQPRPASATQTDQQRPVIRTPHSWLRRRAGLIASFLCLALLPAVASAIYMIFIAADEYHSRASFAVRSIDSAGSSDILGMFTQASSGNTTSDSYILIDFIRSERMLRAIEQNFDVESIYAVRGLDYVYGLRPGLPLEDRLRYWRRMMDVTYDHTSGIMDLTVYAFEPRHSQEIARFVLEESEELINTLSRNARTTVLEEARQEITTAEQRLVQARTAVREYRNETQEIDPVEGARLTGQLISAMELQLAQLNTSLSTARAEMSEDSPRIRVLKSQIDSVRQQIDVERRRIGGGGAVTGGSSATDTLPVAGRLQRFEALETERDFAERAYTAALSSLESARQDANNRQRYLATFLDPTLSERAQYPARFLNSALILLALVFAWTVVVMAWYNIRDRN